MSVVFRILILRKLRSALVYLLVLVSPNRRSTSRYFLVFGLILLFLVVASQERHAVARLGVDEGLSQGSVFDLAQDDKGFIWIATADGLNRFDGYNFEVFSSTLTDSFPLGLTRLRNLFQTKDAIWVTGSQTMVVARIDLVTGDVEQIYDFPEQNGYGDVCPFHLSGDTLWTLVTNHGVVGLSISQHKIIQQFPQALHSFPANSLCCYDSVAGEIWYANNLHSKVRSFSLVDKTYREVVLMEPGSTDTMPVCALLQSADGSLRIGSQGKVIAYHPGTGATTIYTMPVAPENASLITALLVENENSTWCGSNDGFIYRINEVTGEIELKGNPAETMSGIGHRIISMLLDRSGNVWVGTDPAGLQRFDTKQKPFNHTCRNAASVGGLRSNFMKCFAQMGDEMLIGTYDQGINVVNTHTGDYRYITTSGNVQPVIYNVVVDSMKRTWACTLDGIMVAEPGSSQLARPVVQGDSGVTTRVGKTIYRMNNGTILVGLFNGLYGIKPIVNSYVYDPVNVRANVECFCTDHSGGLWMGSSHGIYYSMNGDPHELKLFIPNTGMVKCLYESDDNVMWAGTDHGLGRVDAQARTISRMYTEKDGMPNTFVYGILGDEEDQLWLSTNKGLSRFDPAKESFRNYTVTDGLQSNEFNTNAFYKTTDGELYFGGVNGFNHFYPDAIKDNPYAPECVLTGFKIFDKPFALDSTIEYKTHIELDYTDNNLLLEYTAVEYSDPARNTFRYRLLGLDTNWVEAEDARFARFVNLDPGKYTFQLTAANNDGVWNNMPHELRITITPPFWQTAWFIVSAIVLGLLFMVVTVRYYFRRQVRTQTHEFSLKQSARMNAIIETEERERKRIAEELHDGLGQLLSTARLNISAVDSPLPDKDAQLWKNSLALLDEACSEVRTISHNMMPGALIRSGLIEAVNDLADKINDSGKIQVVFNTELEQRFPETVEIAVYRIVQEILNNMIRHSGADQITIDMKIVNARLQLHIADNGRSFDVSTIATSEGIGWKNIYSRVEILNGEIDVKSEKGKGTSVFLSVSFH